MKKRFGKGLFSVILALAMTISLAPGGHMSAYAEALKSAEDADAITAEETLEETAEETVEETVFESVVESAEETEGESVKETSEETVKKAYRMKSAALKKTGAAAVPAEIYSHFSDGADVEAVAGQEYVITARGAEPDWSKASEGDEYDQVHFTGLTPATEYDIYTRVKASEETEAGEAVITPLLTSLIGISMESDEANGNIYVGSTLTVTPMPEDAAGLSYQWYYCEIEETEDGAIMTNRGDMIEGADSASYKIKAADLDKYLCIVISKNGQELWEGNEWGPVEKADGPEAKKAEVLSWDAESLYIEAVNGQEYVITLKGEEPDWSKAKSGNEDGWLAFENLIPATSYDIYTRVKETEAARAGEAVMTSVLTSLNGMSMDGEPFVGETVTVIPDPEDAKGLTYQWYYQVIDEEEEGYSQSHRGDAITGANSASYTIKAADLGKILCVVISKDGQELDESTIGPVEERPEENYVITKITGTTADASHSWTKGTAADVEITAKYEEGEDESFDHFTGVLVDGKALTKGTDYLVKKGSTIVTLKAAYLEKLSVGAHTVTLQFDNGKAETKLTIKAAAAPAANTSSTSSGTPQTGDPAMTALWTLMAAISGLILCGLAVTYKKRH